ncbi:pollen-specific leucine-rich repeat extensin-like protein 4 [Iris pallida]|uniref:Pollen-specific leucine-rich repeat extensin-like protein 4 n=1 Tax=Iris pallida TaxID=29817 RepID=A0AAX6E6U7_IRIPA|nr:pollen-specific leucine-rich repeat extensin-like protein 4 [Iris pallida]KAJ6824537.1 pollen-specific leucine-rich repeat extensin-like protein 4 [Iris pallida]
MVTVSRYYGGDDNNDNLVGIWSDMTWLVASTRSDEELWRTALAAAVVSEWPGRGGEEVG